MRDAREVGGAWASFQRHAFAAPAGDLAPFVARYWTAYWDLRGQPPYRQLIVPYPNVHLSFVTGTPPTVYGVTRGHMYRVLAGQGRAFGIAFRPGCFRPFLGRPVSSLTDRSVSAAEIFGACVPAAAMAGAPDFAAQVRIAEEFLCAHLPPGDPVAEAVAGMVARIAAEPDLARVEMLAERVGTGVRRLQRLFAGYVGVGPKWVIRRFRLHEVTERLAGGEPVAWARLATDLGYADQAHLTRDFTQVFGEPPTWYAQRYPSTVNHADST
ncbi:MAG TPA: helix-turn-helix domain-containing protein [Rugosimonospora sp.]|nr:helix-turn-helix domain-containing protein [Rugosimonospora sp.]